MHLYIHWYCCKIKVNHWILFYAMLEKVRINSYLLFLHLGFDLLMSPCLFLEPILSKPIFLDIFFVKKKIPKIQFYLSSSPDLDPPTPITKKTNQLIPKRVRKAFIPQNSAFIPASPLSLQL